MDVETVPQLTEDAFVERYLGPGRPVLVKGGASGWPAASWTWERLAALGRDVEVTCEVGDTMQGVNAHDSTTLDAYIRGVLEGSVAGGTYLSQFELLRALPELQADLDFSLFRRFPIRRTLAWIGPAGTHTGIHRDHADNLLAQIRGTKRFRTARPAETDRLYPSRKYDFFTDCSEVSPERWDSARHPGFDAVDWAELVLEPGDLLFNPSGWWHDADALEPSISVNVFAVSVPGLARRLPLLVKEGLHRAGLYRRGWCTCHGRGRVS